MCKISVIIPSYKPKNYIWECLESLRKQTLDKNLFEVIIVLNGCCEPWRGQIERYISNNLGNINLRLFQTDIPGVSNARNMGLDMVTGQYVSFIDDDDYVSSNYLEELYNLSNEHTMALSYELAFEDGSADYAPYSITKDYHKYAVQGTIPFYIPRRFFNGPVYKLISRDVIGKRRFDVSFKNGEDSLFMFLISDKLENVTFTSTKAVYYRRIRKNSATTSKRSIFDRTQNSLRLMNRYIKIFVRNPKGYSLRFLLTRLTGSFISIIYD